MLSVQVGWRSLPLIQAVSEVLDQSKPRMDDKFEMKICVFGLRDGLRVVTLDHELCQVKPCHRHIRGNLCVWLRLADKQAWAQKSESFTCEGRTGCLVYSSLKGSKDGKQ